MNIDINEIPSPLTEEYIISLVSSKYRNALESIRLLHDFLEYTSSRSMIMSIIEDESFHERDLKEQIKLAHLAGEHAVRAQAISQDPANVYEVLENGYVLGCFECSVLWQWYIEYMAGVDYDTAIALTHLACFSERKSLISRDHLIQMARHARARYHKRPAK